MVVVVLDMVVFFLRVRLSAALVHILVCLLQLHCVVAWINVLGMWRPSHACTRCA